MDATGLVEDLRAAGEAFADVPRDEILRILREWAARWQNPAREAGEEDLERLSASTGWPRPHLREALWRAFRPWVRARFGARGSRAARPVRADLWMLAILAGRIPALATGAVFRALAAGVPVVLKPSSVEPVFCEVLARSARRHSDLLGRAVRVVTDPATVASLVREAPACLAYGRDETVDAIRRIRDRAGARPGPTWCGGHRESLVVVFREALDLGPRAARVARGIAEDCAIYDQSGCLSPHLVLVEEGGRVPPETLARMILACLQALETRWPPAPPTVEEAATLRLFAEESRVATRGQGLALPERGPARPLVTLMPQGTERPGPGHRVLQVLTFCGQPDFARQVPSLAGRLQGMAVAGDRARLDRALDGASGYRAPYLCRPGRLQSPPADWLENGLDLTAELVRLGSAGVVTDASRR